MSTPRHEGIDILTVEQIALKGDRWLQNKRVELTNAKDNIHGRFGYTCECCNEWQQERLPNEAEVKAIRAFDYYFKSISRELTKRGAPLKHQSTKPARTGTGGNGHTKKGTRPKRRRDAAALEAMSSWQLRHHRNRHRAALSDKRERRAAL